MSAAKKAASSVLSFFRGATREKSPSRMTGLMGKYNVDSVKYLAKLDQDNAEENGRTWGMILIVTGDDTVLILIVKCCHIQHLVCHVKVILSVEQSKASQTN